MLPFIDTNWVWCTASVCTVPLLAVGEGSRRANQSDSGESAGGPARDASSVSFTLSGGRRGEV
ncbi:hypothetical protein GCM10009754_22110 [Amycolatopsis minnesotensis]|uniref:Secreted protein n=1 Tax=Amycolatopsis minnesotensis TaxID=337894 RepID=A0ABN2QHN1_9PSEU